MEFSTSCKNMMIEFFYLKSNCAAGQRSIKNLKLCMHCAFYSCLLPAQVNQVKGLYVEDSVISGSAPNGVGLDGVAVQYGHVCRSEIHSAD